MKLLCITDPLTHPPFDTTVELYNRLALDPRFDVFHLDANEVRSAPVFPVVPVPRALTYPEFRALSRCPAQTAGFRDFDLAISRTDLPWPPGFIDTLVRHEDDVPFVARPSGMRDCSIRTFTRSVAAPFMPPGIVTRDPAKAAEFVRTHDRAVAKAHRSYGGRGVARLWREGSAWWCERAGMPPESHGSLDALIASVLDTDPEPFEFVRYLPRVTEGDKRVVAVEGEIYGGYLRVAAGGGWINNMTSGGTTRPASVTPREREVVEATWQAYHARGVPTLGYDFLVDDSGEWILSEINASSNIGGYSSLERLSGQAIYARFLDWLARLPGRAP